MSGHDPTTQPSAPGAGVRVPTHEELCHERLGDKFGDALNDYDTQRRVEVLVDQFLTNEMLRDKRVLDVGCGLGFFSRRLQQRGANVLACDIGPKLVEQTRQYAGCEAVVADALALREQFGEASFDGVVSSECIEHVPDPVQALLQMAAVVKPGGFLSISTPNWLWWPITKLATVLKLRPFDGHERFSSFRSLESTLSRGGATVVSRYGLHLFPFQFGCHGLSTWCDEHCQGLRSLMINLCVLARKESAKP